MKYSPLEHHKLGIEHLIKNLEACLFAGCGLGKTGMTLAALDYLFSDLSTLGVLIVAPIRVCNLTWPHEVAQWDQFSWMRVANMRTKEGQKAWREGSAHIYLINFESLPMLCQKFMDDKEIPVDTLIVDELSKAKSPSSMRINTLRRHRHRFKRAWGLTGTPMPNDKLDLFSQIRLIDRGQRFGSNFTKFRNQFFYPLDKDMHKWALRDACDSKVEAKLSDLVLTLKSSDWLDIPDVHIEDVEVTLPDKVRGLYKKLKKELVVLLGNNEINAINAAVLIMKLIQLTSGSIYDAERNVIELHDSKLKECKRIVKSHEGEPVLITYMFKHEEERLLKAFPDAISFSQARTEKQQTELAELWNAGHVPVMLAHPASVGHGINLQKGGRIMIWFSLTWSRELYDQMIARLARYGQEAVTLVYRLLCSNTVDDAVAEALREKGEDQAALMDAIAMFRELEDPSGGGAYDVKLLELFNLKPELTRN